MKPCPIVLSPTALSQPLPRICTRTSASAIAVVEACGARRRDRERRL
jgi:hypothetical protein